MIGVSPSVIAAAVSERCSPGRPDLNVLWCWTTESRSIFATQLNDEICDLPAVALVARGVRFRDPNSVLDDFVALLEDHRDEVLAGLAGVNESLRVVVIVSRSAMCLPQLSSPAILPDWLPGGGRTIEVCIDDVTLTATVPLNSVAMDVPGLAADLFEWDVVATDRLQGVCAANKDKLHGLFDRIARPDEKVADFLNKARSFLDDVQNPEGYRPSAKAGSSLVSRLWSATQAEAPDSRGRLGGALATALGLADQAFPPEPLVAVLGRSSTPLPHGPKRYGMALLGGIAAACQLTTASAHADDYPSFPAALQQTVSYDLRSFLQRSSDLLRFA
jgi:hypothetical protein